MQLKIHVWWFPLKKKKKRKKENETLNSIEKRKVNFLCTFRGDVAKVLLIRNGE